MANKVKANFWLDTVLLTLFATTATTGLLLWQVVPGGRDNQGVTWLGLTHSNWNQIHVWAGIGLLIGSVVHLVWHWQWISCIADRIFGKVAQQARLNFWLDTLLFTFFLLVNGSGLLIEFILPSGGFQGGRNPFYNMTFLALARQDWRVLHLWAGLALIIILMVHLALHWHWIACVIRRYTRAVLCRPKECTA
ncbi:MAG: DUF4405 domain-containing protein [Anaerolineae bacterium]|nr:DUF4405 domain-containing protein [Anaerolineae bacterium]